MKTPEWLKEFREWLGTLALLVVAVLGLVFVPDYLKRAEKERQEREALMKYIRETTPQEHIERMKKLAEEKAAKEQAAREAGEK
jgi:hypothetical protein